MLTTRLTSIGVAACLGLSCLNFATAQQIPLALDRNLVFNVSDKFTYDDNVFRLPAANTPGVVFPGPGFGVSDEINTAALGMNGLWTSGLQTVLAKLGIADNVFRNNTALDNVSGSGNLEWDWVFTDLFGGKLGADYSRGLADFANTTFYAKDLISDTDYYANALWDLGPHWRLTGNIRGENTTHSASALKGDDFDSRSGGIGTEYELSPTNSVGIDYKFTDVEFHQGPGVGGNLGDSDYEDNAISVDFKYSLTAVTTLDVGGGYVRRRYSPGDAVPVGTGNFSGDVWHITANWQPTAISGVQFKAWRDLRAYIDAGSDYFVSNGVSVGPTWSPLERLVFNLIYARESQNFIGSTQVIGTLPQRRDVLQTGKLGIQYKIRRRVEIDAAYSHEQRTSDVSEVRYKDNLASVSAQYSF